MKNILVTGATGFIGSSLVSKLTSDYNIHAPVRNFPPGPTKNVNYYKCSDFHDFTFFPSAIKIDYVIHLAGAAHGKVSEDMFFTINVAYTLKLLEECRIRGVSRFIFLSSIGVNGNCSTVPFSNFDTPNPSDPYSKSKSEAEKNLKQLCLEYGIELVIIRPPLVYGKSAPGNFSSLLKVIYSNIPLPLASINNSRSFVHLDNLNSLILICLTHENAKNRTFLVSDGDDISISKFIKLMILHSGSKTICFPLSLSILRFLAFILGRTSMLNKLTSDLQVDISYTANVLGWKPIVNVEEGLKRCFSS